MSGGQALAELVEQGGHQVFQTGDGDGSVQLYSIQTSITHGLNNMIDVDQMHCGNESDKLKP